jgi:hypothetical protein
LFALSRFGKIEFAKVGKNGEMGMWEEKNLNVISFCCLNTNYFKENIILKHKSNYVKRIIAFIVEKEFLFTFAANYCLIQL